MSLTIERQAGALGAHISGVDLQDGLRDDVFDAIHEALLEHLVVCIRGQQHLTSDGQLDFAKRWGDVLVHPYVPSIEGYPGILKVYDPHPVTTTWHSDTTHSSTPPAATMLLARTVPPVGGDTMFASQYAAYDSLSRGLQETLLSLRAVHQGTDLAADAGLEAGDVTAVHPAVRTHPETGRRGLFVNGNYTKRFDGWTAGESAPLLGYLYAQACRPEFTWRHRWHEGDLLIWDNRCTQHAVIGDVGGAERILHRITIRGDVPV